MSALRATLDLISSLRHASQMKSRRGIGDLLADRIVQAGSEPNLIAAIERLTKSLDCSIDYVGGDRVAAFMRTASGPEAHSVLLWLRRHPRVAAMVAGLRDEDDYGAAIDSIVLPAAEASTGDHSVAPAPNYDVGIHVELLAPLSHGADGKAGNATLFRRRQIITPSGAVMELPFYGDRGSRDASGALCSR